MKIIVKKRIFKKNNCVSSVASVLPVVDASVLLIDAYVFFAIKNLGQMFRFSDLLGILKLGTNSAFFSFLKKNILFDRIFFFFIL